MKRDYVRSGSEEHLAMTAFQVDADELGAVQEIFEIERAYLGGTLEELGYL